MNGKPWELRIKISCLVALACNLLIEQIIDYVSSSCLIIVGSGRLTFLGKTERCDNDCFQYCSASNILFII